MRTGRVVGRMTCTDTCRCHPPGPDPGQIATSHVVVPGQSRTSPTGTTTTALSHSADQSSKAVITCAHLAKQQAAAGQPHCSPHTTLPKAVIKSTTGRQSGRHQQSSVVTVNRPVFRSSCQKHNRPNGRSTCQRKHILCSRYAQMSSFQITLHSTQDSHYTSQYARQQHKIATFALGMSTCLLE